MYFFLFSAGFGGWGKGVEGRICGLPPAMHGAGARLGSQWTRRKPCVQGPLRRAHPASGATWNVQVVINFILDLKYVERMRRERQKCIKLINLYKNKIRLNIADKYTWKLTKLDLIIFWVIFSANFTTKYLAVIWIFIVLRQTKLDDLFNA